MKTKISALPLGVASAAIVTLGWAVPTHALTVIGNDLYDVTTNPFSQASEVAPTRQQAVTFTTNNSSWTLNSITLSLSGFTTVDAPSIQIRSDNAGDPASTGLVSLGSPSPAPTGVGAIRNFTFTPSTGFTFAANTNYWLVLTTTNASSYNWAEMTNNTTPTSAVGWSFLRYETSFDTGANWTDNDVNNAFVIDATEITPIPFAFSPIPGLIVSGIIGKMRRSRSRTKNAAQA